MQCILTFLFFPPPVKHWGWGGGIFVMKALYFISEILPFFVLYNEQQKEIGHMYY
jgi:hypothetical protein